MRVLVVEDDEIFCQFLTEILESRAIEVVQSTDGLAGYEKASSMTYDLIILDVLLSGNDGRQICKSLKHDTKTREIPVLMMSAHPTAKDSVRECGADSFIEKPFSVTGLLGEVKKYIG